MLKEIKNREKTQSIILKNLGIKITGLNEEKDEEKNDNNLEEEKKGKEDKNNETGMKGHLLNFDDENWDKEKKKKSIINKRKRGTKS